MSEIFEKALVHTMQYEGGWTDDKNDLGGATNYGISIVFAQGTKDFELFDLDGDGDIDRTDIKNLTPEIAHDAYKEYFWDKNDLDNYAPKIAFVLFDCAVNHGPGNMAKMFQMAINKCGQDIEVDGGIGNKTLTALNECDPECIVTNLIEVRREFFKKITIKRPANKVFLKGWLNRCNSLEKAVQSF